MTLMFLFLSFSCKLKQDSEGTSLIREAVSEMTNHEFHGWKWQTHISTLLKAKAVHRDDPLGYKYDQEY